MQQAPRAHWGVISGLFFAITDAMIDGLYEGALASMPGQNTVPGSPGLCGFDSVDALPLIGRDRGYLQGQTETVTGFAHQLVHWREGWIKSASCFGMLEQLARVLGPNGPVMRLVNPGGCWHTRDIDGTFHVELPFGGGFDLSPTGAITVNTTSPHPWNWDSLTVPPGLDQGSNARFWIILYVPTNNGTRVTATEGTLGDGTSQCGTNPDWTVGTNATQSWEGILRAVIRDWRAAGVPCSYIILAFDPASFNPATKPAPGDGFPDGYWGQGSKLGTGNALVPSRLSSARYLRAVTGTAIA